VRRVEPAQFAPLAYPILCAALLSYGERPPERAQFISKIRKSAEYPGTEYWGAFRGTDMAAFSTCRRVDDAITLGSTKSVPELHRYNPNAALFYTIAMHYLGSGALYVTNGSRTLWHPTSINEFLLRLGFRRAYCRLNIEFSPLLSPKLLVAAAKWARYAGLTNRLGQRGRQLSGLSRMIEIAKTFQ
jgi:hypothetical protein